MKLCICHPEHNHNHRWLRVGAHVLKKYRQHKNTVLTAVLLNRLFAVIQVALIDITR